MAVIEEVARYVQDNGLGVMGTDLFGHIYPPRPDDVIVLTQIRPGDAIRTMSKTLDHVVEPFTVTVRNTSPTLAYTKAWAIFTLLDNFTGLLSGINYRLIVGRGVPFNVGPDENNRLRWSCDYWASKDPS